MHTAASYARWPVNWAGFDSQSGSGSKTQIAWVFLRTFLGTLILVRLGSIPSRGAGRGGETGGRKNRDLLGLPSTLFGDAPDVTPDDV